MSAASTYQNAFQGLVERVNSAASVAIVQGEGRYTSVSETRRFSFLGLSRADAYTETSQTVTSGGANYTVPFKQKFVDASTGYAVMPKETVRVSRKKQAGGLYDVTVEMTGVKYYRNGTRVKDGPSWMSHYNDDGDMS